MKNLVRTLAISIFFILFYSHLTAQSNIDEQFVLGGKLFEISAVTTAYGQKVTISHNNDATSFELRSLKIEVFRNLFMKSIKDSLGVSDLIDDEINNKADEQFFILYSSLNVTPAPKSGVMIFSDEMKIYPEILNTVYRKIRRTESQKGKKKWRWRYDRKVKRISNLKERYETLLLDVKGNSKVDSAYRKFKTDTVQIEILNGTIRNVIVAGRFLDEQGKIYIPEFIRDRGSRVTESEYKPNNTRTYKSRAPIGISSLYDIQAMYHAKLVNANDPFDPFRLELRELLKYYPYLSLKSDDYSPKDGVYVTYRNKHGELPPIRLLYKEDTKHLFVSKVFSDFSGFTEENPNGLVQVEVDKDIIINAQNGKLIHLFNYLRPQIKLAKIENKLRDLNLNESDKSFNGLNILRFNNLSFSTRLNFITLDMPEYKFALRYDLVGTGYWTSVIPVNESEANSEFSYGLDHSLSVEFRPDTRWTIAFDFLIGRVRNIRTEFPLSGGRTNSANVDISFRPTVDKLNEVFLRGSTVFDTQVESFQRFQLGYAFPIIKTKN